MKKITALLLSLIILSAAVLTATALTPHGNGIKVRNWLTNDPDYTFSDSYKTSVWYENFTKLELGENERNNVLMVALSQLGYTGGEQEGDYDGSHSTTSNQYTEYARLFIPNYNNNTYDWCATFVNWSLNQARIDHAYGEMSCQRWMGDFLVPEGLYQKGKAYGGKYTPKPADMIFFDWEHDKAGRNGVANHIGLVLYTDSQKVYTIEGNSSNRVVLKSYSLSSLDVLGYGTPKYNEGTQATVDYSTKEFVSGYYINSANSTIKLYSSADTQSSYENIPAYAMIKYNEIIGENEWMAVSYNGVNGYIKHTSASLQLVITDEFKTVIPPDTTDTPTDTEEITTEITTEEESSEPTIPEDSDDIAPPTTPEKDEPATTDTTHGSQSIETLDDFYTTRADNTETSGCASAISTSIILTATASLAAVLIIKKKKEDK